MDISNREISTINDILAEVEKWKKASDKCGPDSKGSQRCGSKAMILLCQHTNILDAFQQRFRASVGTPGIIMALIDIAEKFSCDEIKSMGGESGYYLCLGQWKGFIPDLKRWITEARTEQNDKRKKPQYPEGEISKPMSKSEMMKALRIDSYKKFNAWGKDKALKQTGNRQTFTIRLDLLDTKSRQRLEKV